MPDVMNGYKPNDLQSLANLRLFEALRKMIAAEVPAMVKPMIMQYLSDDSLAKLIAKADQYGVEIREKQP